MKLTTVKEMIEGAVTLLECDDELPDERLLIEKEDGELVFALGLLQGTFLSGQALRQARAAAIVKAIKYIDGRAACYIAPCWGVESESVSPVDEGDLAERSDKYEAVVCITANRNGQDDGMAFGRIIRSTEHPRVSWLEEDDTDTSRGGQILEALRQGVRASSAGNATMRQR